MKKLKKLTAFLLLVVLTLVPFTGCAKDENYMPAPIFAEAVYTAETWKGIGFVEFPYYTVYSPESLEGMYIKAEGDGKFSASQGGVAYDEKQMTYLESFDGYKIIKLFDLLKAAHFYHYEHEDGIHKYYIDVVFDNADGQAERFFIYTDEYGYLTNIRSKDGDLKVTLTRMDLEE